jgi:hypothetical protein
MSDSLAIIAVISNLCPQNRQICASPCMYSAQAERDNFTELVSRRNRIYEMLSSAAAFPASTITSADENCDHPMQRAATA